MTIKLKATLAQLNPTVGDLEGNARKIAAAYEQACREGADILILPEMIVTGYPPEDLILKPFFMASVESAINDIVGLTRAKSPAMLLTAPWREGKKIYNATLLIENGEIKDRVYKKHLPNYGVFDEERIFDPGPLPEPVHWRGLNLGVLICEDMWYPDVAGHLADQGADLFIIPNGSPYEVDKGEIRLDHARRRVEETGLPLIYVNQVGGQDELVFDGASFVLSDEAQLVYQAEEFAEETRTLTFEKKEEATHWLIESPHLMPVHEMDLAVYQAVVTGLRDYVTKNGFPGVIIGLSGGIDSALTAAIAVDALGSESVRCVMMPSPFTAQDSLDDAQACATALGVTLETIKIAPAMSAFEEMIPNLQGVAHENMQSRSRGLILMALSNMSGHMVVSTGNKSEMAVGYATLYGDMNGGFNVLKDIYKTQAYRLAHLRNRVRPDHTLGPEGLVVPDNILSKAPSAELKEDQKDTDSLPTYEELDDILMCLIERDMGVPAIAERGHEQALVEKVWRMLDRAEYKRRQAPPGVKITSRAFGRDRRYPITNRFVTAV